MPEIWLGRMGWIVRPMSLQDARQVITWEYPEPYDVYNLACTDEVLEELTAGSYRAAADGKTVCGFFCTGQDARVPGGNYSDPALDVGLGLRPDLTGQGRGEAFVADILDYLQPTVPVRLTVASFNQRAQRCYGALGFETVGSFRASHGDFVLMRAVWQTGTPKA